jgi:hypothetical protein
MPSGVRRESMASVLIVCPRLVARRLIVRTTAAARPALPRGRQVGRQLQADGKVQRRRRLPLIGEPQDAALGCLNAILRNPRLGLLGDTAQSDWHIRIIAHLSPRFLADARRLCRLLLKLSRLGLRPHITHRPSRIAVGAVLVGLDDAVKRLPSKTKQCPGQTL